MASLAGMLQARGHLVTGSDQNVYPPMSEMLAGLGIPVTQGYDAAHLEPAPDCVVIGNALSRGNAEVETVLNRKLLYRSQAEVVKEEFIHGRHSLVVAGTHGKTTTTSLATWVLEMGGLHPGFRVGGVVQNFGANLHPQLETFGTSVDAKWQARDIAFAGELMRFRVFREQALWGEFETTLAGEFNVRNCLAVIIAADAWGVEQAAIREALKTFKSVQRRMQVRGEVGGVLVIDDFAHHPTAVRETLQALRAKYTDRRLVAA